MHCIIRYNRTGTKHRDECTIRDTVDAFLLNGHMNIMAPRKYKVNNLSLLHNGNTKRLNFTDFEKH